MTTTAAGPAPTPGASRPGRLDPYHAATVFAVGLAARLWLIHSFPVIFGGDSIMRLVNKDRILLSYQLPLLQACVHYLSGFSENPLIVRYFMALAGALAGLAFYALAASLLGRRVGLQTSLLFATSPFVLAFSIVPYQEILMLAGLFAAFFFAFEQRWAGAGLLLGLACLTRYEAWLACPVLAAGFLVEKGFRPVEIGKAALLFGWAPLGWIAAHGGITPEGAFAAEAAFSFERFFRYVYLGWITVKNTPLPVLLLALFGAWLFWKQRLFQDPRYRMLGAFLALFLAAVLLSAHGERDQPERFVTAREAHILLAATVLSAGIALGHLRRFRWTLALLSTLAGLWMAHRFVANETSQPPFALSYQAALYLDRHVAPGEKVVVLAEPIPRELLAGYLDRAERAGGSSARRKAIEVLLDLDNSPPNYQRILVHSRLAKEQLRSVSSLPADLVPPIGGAAAEGSERPAWVVLWSDFRPANAIEEELQGKIEGQQPVEVLAKEGLRVEIYQVDWRGAS